MGFKVLDTQRITSMTPAGNPIQYYRVSIVTDRGASGQIEVPMDRWNEKELPVFLKRQADEMDLAFNLKGE